MATPTATRRFPLQEPGATPFSRSILFQFALAFALFTAVADTTSFVGWSLLAGVIKYAYTATLLSIMYVYLCRWAAIDWGSPAPALALLFFVVAGLVFAVNTLVYGVDISYIAAFAAPLVFAAALVIPRNAFEVDVDRIIDQLMRFFAIAVFFYLVESFLKTSSIAPRLFSPEMEHVKSIVCVLAVSLCVLLERYRQAGVLVGLIAVALLARPTSTLLIGLVVGVGLALALKTRRWRLAKFVSYTTLVVMAVSPLLFYYYYDAMADTVRGFEPFIKGDVLGGESNTEFRLAVFKLALMPLDKSMLFGLGLSGDPNVPLGLIFPWWRDVVPDGTVLIHSDFLVILGQSGLVGYGLFVAFLWLMLAHRFSVLKKSPPADAKSTALIYLSLIAIVSFILYASFNPFLPLYHTNHILWLVLLVSELVTKRALAARAEPQQRWRGRRLAVPA